MDGYQRLVKLTQENPKEAEALVEKWVVEHPNDVSSANLLAYLFLQLRQLKKAEKIIEKNYQRFPNHLMVKINYGDLCLRRKRLEEIPQIFPSFDLKSLYPKQNELPPSHIRAFAVLMGRYHLKIRNRKAAEKFYILAVSAEPLHPSVGLLERKLFRFSWLKKLLPKIGRS